MADEHYAKGALADDYGGDNTGTAGYKPPSHDHPHHGAHVEKLTGGTHLVTKHHKDGSHSRHSAANLDEAMDHVMGHMSGDEGGGEPAASGAPASQPPEMGGQ